MADKTKGNRSLPPRLCNKQNEHGIYYVLFAQDGRGQRQSLRTKDRQEAEVRFLGWLEQRQKDIISLIETDPEHNIFRASFISFKLDIPVDKIIGFPKDESFFKY